MKTLRTTIFILILALSFALTGCGKNDGMIADVTQEPTVPAATVAAPEITAPPVTAPAATGMPDVGGILFTESPTDAPSPTSFAG